MSLLLLLVGLGLAADAPTGLEEIPAFSVDTGSRDPGPWWPSFGVGELDRVVDSALTGNLDIAGARFQVAQLQGVERQTMAGFLPQASLDFGAQMSPRDTQGFGFGIDIPEMPGQEPVDESDTFTTGSLLFNVSLPIDIWGQGRLGWQAARLDAAGALENRDAQAMVVAQLVAEGWFDLAAAQQQLSIVQEQAATQDDLLQLVEARYQTGAAGTSELLQQRQQRAGASTLIPDAERQVRAARTNLAVLLAENPVTFDLPGDAGLPELPGPPGLGSPQDLLDARPDLRAAQASATASLMRQRSATRAFLPSLAVSGNAGWQGLYQDEELDTIDSWGLGVSASLPLFSGGQNWGAVQQTQAGYDAALVNLQATSINAVREVEDAWYRERAGQQTLEARRAELEASQLAFEESRDQYVEGLTTYTAVLTSLNLYRNAQLSELASHRQLLSARVGLHTALGGDWTRDLGQGSAQ